MFRRSKERQPVAARNMIVYLAIKNGVCSRVDAARFFGVSQSVVTRGYYSLLNGEYLLTISERIDNEINQIAISRA